MMNLLSQLQFGIRAIKVTNAAGRSSFFPPQNNHGDVIIT